jgi:hypothetical protein
MTPNKQRDAALALLAQTGIWPSNYAPPLFHLLWRMGVDVPPPHFVRFASVVIFMGTFFGGMFALFMWPTLWTRMGLSFGGALIRSGVAGLVFGLAMAGYYAYGRRRHRLPSWDELGSK